MAKKKSNKFSTSKIQKKKKALPKIVPHPWMLKGTTKWIVALAIGLVGVLLYLPSHNYDFVYDDDAVIKDNRFVKAGLDGLGDIWTTSYFQGYDMNISARAFRPVPLSTLAVEFELFDEKRTENGTIIPSPGLYHKTNLLYYGLTGVFLFLFLSTLLRKYHPALAILTALFFMLHPIHLEVVANIKSRDTMLGFLNYVLAAWFLLKYMDDRKWWQMATALLFYMIGLFSKDEIITTLATLPLMLYFFRAIKPIKLIGYTAPFLAVAIFYLIVRTMVIAGGDFSQAESLGELLNPGIELKLLDNSLLGAETTNEKTASCIYVMGYYLKQAFFPSTLISDYSFSTIPLFRWSNWQVWLALLVHLGLIGLAVQGWRNKRVYSFAILYYFIALSIFSNLVITNVSVYNDRFLYHSSLGVCIGLAYALTLLMKQADGKFELGHFVKNNWIPLALVAVIAALSIYKIETHLPLWKDRYGLFAHDAAAAPTNARMRKNNGGSLARLAIENQQTDINLARDYARKAIAELEAALDIYDRMETGHTHLGNMYIILGEYANAEKALKRALTIFPNGFFSRTSLANVLYRQGKYQESVDMLEQLPKERFSQNQYNLLYLGYSKLGDTANMEKYRVQAGR